MRLASLFGIRLGQLRQYPPRPLQLPDAPDPPLPDPPPRISIVTPSFQQGRFLQRTIESVLSQNYPNLEYFIEDGGSTDETADVLDRYAKRLSGVRSGTDEGQADAVNRGFARSTGVIMAWLNADDVLLPGALACVARFMHAYPDADYVYGHRIVIDASDKEVGRWMLPRHNDTVLKLVDFVPQETLFWRRQAWESTGASLDSSYQFAMDWELLLRFSASGLKAVRIPAFLAAMRTHDQQKTLRDFATVGLGEIARLRSKYPGYRLAALALAPYLAESIVLDLRFMWKTRLRLD